MCVCVFAPGAAREQRQTPCSQADGGVKQQVKKASVLWARRRATWGMGSATALASLRWGQRPEGGGGAAQEEALLGKEGATACAEAE